MDASRDRNRLFGVFAVQLRGVRPEQLAEISVEWSADPSKSLAQRMIEKNILTGEDCAVLEKLVDDAIYAHGGKSGELLALFGGEEQIEKVFFRGVSSSYLRQMDTVPMVGGEDAFGSGPNLSGVSETPGRYTLVSHHAKGGMGQVLIVHDEHLGRNIALKELMLAGGAGGTPDTPIRQSASLVARFLQEAKITSQLEHPAIVPVYELGRREDGTLYYTMRLVRGKTFAAALRECGGLDERLRLLSNFVSLCQAIAYAHSHGIIHRDIKPANVMLGQFGETVVLDWGLAKLRNADDIHVEGIKDAFISLDLEGESPLPNTVYGLALGTPHYMPPEQAAGHINEIDERSDVYSLGAVLYEILTGTTPHSGRSTREILEKVLHKASVPVLETAPDAPPELAVICEKALKREAADRYQTAAELAAEVERFIQGSLVRAYRYSLKQILAHYYTKHRPLINTALACAVILLVMGVTSYVSILHARNREHEQRLAAEAARADAEHKTYQSQAHLAQAHIREKNLGRAADLLWETAEKERGWEWRYLLNRANPGVCAVEIPNSTLSSAVFSPDGSKIGTNTSPEPPSIYDALSGRKLVALEGGGEKEEYSQTAFSPDGTRYMGVSWEGAVNVWDSLSGKRLLRFPLNALGYGAVFDASGSFLFAGAGDRKVHVFDLQRGAPAYELNVDTGPVDYVLMSPRKDRLLTMTPGGPVQLWDLAAKTVMFRFAGSCPVFSPDGARIAALQEADAVVWNAETGAEMARLKGHTQPILGICFNGDGSRLLSASQDETVLMWDLDSAGILQIYALPTKSPPVHAFFLGAENFVLACSADNQCVLFDAQTGSCISRTQGRGQHLNLADRQPGGDLLAITSDDHVFEVLNPLAPTGVETLVTQLGTNDGLSRGITASASGKLLAFFRGLNRESVWLVDTDRKKGLCSFSASFDCTPEMPALSGDGSRLAMVADKHSAAIVANPASTQPSVTFFTGHTAPVESIALQSDGRAAATGDNNGEICLWSTDSAQTLHRWKAHEGCVTHLQFSVDGQRLLSCGLDGQTMIWSCETGETLFSFTRQDKEVLSAVFNEDETRVLTVDAGGVVQLWDAVHGESVGRAAGCPSISVTDNTWTAVEALFWPGGNRFLTQYPGEGSLLWDAKAMSPLLFFEPDERVLPLCDGQSLAVSDRLGNLRTIRMPDGTTPTRADFQKYQTEWASRKSVDASQEPCPIYVFISREDMMEGIDGLISGEAARPQPGPAAPCVEANNRTQAMAAMGLDVGDCIVAVNDVQFLDTSAAKAALENATSRLSQDPQAGLALTVSRNGQERRNGYWTIPLTREEEVLTLTRGEALWLVQFEIDRAALQMETRPTSAWLSLGPLPEEPVLAKANLAYSVALTALDGAPCNSIGTLRQALIDLKRRIAAGGAVQFSQTFREGVYRELVRPVTVEGE